MKLLAIAIITSLLAACALDMGQQSEVFNSRDVFAKHEKNLNLQP